MTWQCGGIAQSLCILLRLLCFFFFLDRRGTTALGGLGFGSSVSTASFMSPAHISLAADIHKQGLSGCQQASATSESKRNKKQKEEEEKDEL